MSETWGSAEYSDNQFHEWYQRLKAVFGMKQVIETYGRFVLEAVVVSFLFILLFTQITDKDGNKGVLKIIGAGLETGGVDYGSYTDFDVYQAENAKSG